ncbi:MAG TPA: hypothetical protein VK806_03785 [Bacteroidia bacterium]|jgi:hypothetical protein|nr:hypothetical protein [Bacteroidia bacterium]
MKTSIKLFAVGIVACLLSACSTPHSKQENQSVSSVDAINTNSRKGLSIKSPYDTVALLKLFNPERIIKNIGYYEDSTGLEGAQVYAIMTIPSNSSERYLIVFSSNQYFADSLFKNITLDDNHAASAINSLAEVDKVGSSFNVIGFSLGFDTTGQFANPGDFSLEKFGTDNYLLHVSSSSSGQGEVTDHEQYVTIPEGNQVLFIENYDNEDAWGRQDSSFEKIENKIKKIPGANIKYDDLDVTTITTRYDIKKKKNYELISKTLYKMDDKAKKYIKYKQ